MSSMAAQSSMFGTPNGSDAAPQIASAPVPPSAKAPKTPPETLATPISALKGLSPREVADRLQIPAMQLPLITVFGSEGLLTYFPIYSTDTFDRDACMNGRHPPLTSSSDSHLAGFLFENDRFKAAIGLGRYLTLGREEVWLEDVLADPADPVLMTGGAEAFQRRAQDRTLGDTQVIRGIDCTGFRRRVLAADPELARLLEAPAPPPTPYKSDPATSVLSTTMEAALLPVIAPTYLFLRWELDRSQAENRKIKALLHEAQVAADRLPIGASVPGGGAAFARDSKNHARWLPAPNRPASGQLFIGAIPAMNSWSGVLIGVRDGVVEWRTSEGSWRGDLCHDAFGEQPTPLIKTCQAFVRH